VNLLSIIKFTMEKINFKPKNFQKKLTYIKNLNIFLILIILIFSVRESSAQTKNIPFSKQEALDLCSCLRTPVKAPQNREYYDFEWRLMRLAGVKDPLKEDEEIIKNKVSNFVDKYHIELECPYADTVFPKGGFYRQLVTNDIRFGVQMLLEDYNINPNLIDSDGCTVLDYIDMILTRNQGYEDITTEKFRYYKKIFLKHNAKNASDLGGCCGCKD